MKEQIAQTQNWIRRVQRSSDKVKRVWLVVLSGCAMLLVIFFWLAYLSFTMPKLRGVAEERGASVEQGTPFWKTFGEGFSVIGERMWSEIRNTKKNFANFKETVEKKIDNFSNEFTIEGQ